MSYDIVQEDDVPPFIKRVGDHATQGSNNTIIILGTDRAKKGPATIKDGLGSVDSDGKGKGTGTVHIIAGRKDKDGNPDLDKDSAYLYLSMKTDVDKNLGTDMEKDAGKVPSAILKSDAVRLIGRKDIKIVFDGEKSYIHLTKDQCVIKIEDTGYIKIKKGKIIVDADSVELGEGATEKVILGDKFMELYMAHQHPTGVGPSGPPLKPMTAADHLSGRKVTVK